MPQFSRLKLTKEYIKIVDESTIIDWAKKNSDNENTRCPYCNKRLVYRDCHEGKNEFYARFTCSNHSQTTHFSFRFPKTKTLFDKMKKEDKPVRIRIAFKIDKERLDKLKTAKDDKEKAEKVKAKDDKAKQTAEPIPPISPPDDVGV